MIHRRMAAGPGLCIVASAVAFLLCVPASAAEKAAVWYQTPQAAFILGPSEEVRRLSPPAGPVAAVQQAIDEARRAAPEAVLVVRLDGTYTVTDQPLKIGSRTCVLFAPGSRLVAGEGAKAAALVLIEKAEYVALAGEGEGEARPVLDGCGVIRDGISVSESGKVHIDRLEIRSCCCMGVHYTGRGADVWADAGSLTRCRVTFCGYWGIQVSHAAQFVCLDNELADLESTGALIDSPGGVIINNTITRCGIGLTADGSFATVARNRIEHCDSGIVLNGNRTLVTENRVTGNNTGIDVNGQNNALHANVMDNKQEFIVDAPGNLIAGHAGVGRREVVMMREGSDYFNPPTATNENKETEIVRGLGRHDLALGAAGKTTDLSEVQAALDKARQEHPKDVLVARLKGLFLATGEGTGLTIPPDTCILLEGEIRSASDGLDHRKSPKGKDTALIRMPTKGCVSISGGVIDGAGQTYNVINATGSAAVILDGVTVQRAGFNNIYTKERHDPKRPMFIRNCTVKDSGNRGIWAHVCQAVHVIGTTCTGNGSDGIDMDAYGDHNTALFNTCTGNGRDGVFVEEGATGNLVFGNQLQGNKRHGVCLYNNAVKQRPTARNVIACNRLADTGGLSVRGMSAEIRSDDNLLFNNVAPGLDFAGKPNARNNYWAQNTLRCDPATMKATPGLQFFVTPAAGAK